MKLAARLVCAAALVWTCLLVLGFALEHARTVDYSPINGRFQDFDPVRRLAEGQWIGRDFDAYLGIGPVYALRTTMLVCGDDFRASVCAAHLLSASLHAATFLVLARLCGLRWLGAATLTAGVVTLAQARLPAWIPESWRETNRTLNESLFDPGNSALGARAAAPLLALGASLFVLRWLRHASLTRRAIAVGAVAGAAALWSNDYGAPTAAALLTCTAFARPDLAGQRWRFFGIALAAALPSALLVLTLVTGFAPGEWLDYNFRGVALEQRWAFYLREVEGPRAPQLLGWLVAGFVALAVLAARAWRQRARAGETALLVLVCATLAAAVLAASASPQLRYAMPLARVLIVVLPYLVIVHADELWLRFGSGAGRARAVRVVHAVGLALGLAWIAVQAPARGAKLALAFERDTPVADAEPALAVPEPALAVPEPALAVPELGLAVPELGGQGDPALDKLVALGRRIRAEAEHAGIPRERRLFATYATGLTVIADAVQPTRADYIIHALGAQRRSAYVADFTAAEPLYVATQRGRYANWEAWARKRHWEFYRELYRTYAACDSSLEHLLWRRRATPLEPAAIEVRCELSPDGAPRSTLTLAIDPAEGVPAGEVWVVDLELDFDAFAGREPGVFESLRAGVLVVDHGATSLDRLAAVRASVGHIAIPVDVTAGTPAQLELRSPNAALPPPRARRARARALAPRRDLERVARTQLVAAEYTDANWTHGVSTLADASGFFVRDPFDLEELAAGTRLRFPRSGARTVVRVESPQVWVDGPPLDPAGDGYPHWIEIVRE